MSGLQRKKGKVTTVPALIQQFTQQLSFVPTSKSKLRNFNKDTFSKAAQEHVNLFSISKYPVNENYMAANNTNGPVVISHCATFKDNIFFRDPYDGRLFSCCDKEVEREMERRGFFRVGVLHILGPGVDLPILSNSKADEFENIDSCAAPMEITLPQNHKYPKLWKFNDETTTAAAVVQAFEDKVVDPVTKAVFSPYRLWTLENRERVKMEKSTNLTKYCQMYFAIRTLKLNPQTETRGINDLAKLATAYARENFSEKPDWFHKAVEAYNLQ